MNQKVVLGIIIVVLLAVGGYFMFGKAPDGDSWNTELKEMQGEKNERMEKSANQTMTPTTESSTTSELVDGVKVFTINGSNFKFEPNMISVNKGDKIKIVFKNTGGFHDLVIDELGVKTKQIGANSEDSVEFTADKVGSFEFYCSVGNHRAMGMKGTLVVQ
jgi:plastocyanin